MSFYCPQCNNIYTKITPSAKEGFMSRLKAMKGGKKTESETPNTVSSTEQIGGDDLQNIINKILDGQKLSAGDVKNIDLNEMVKVPAYKKLQAKQKEAVYNIISDLQPKKNNNNEDIIMESKAYFECTNCGFVEPVKDGTLIIRKMKDTTIGEDFTNYKELIHAKELPITRAYVCPNKQCKSHTDLEQREAVLFRSSHSLKINYVCRSCTAHW